MFEFIVLPLLVFIGVGWLMNVMEGSEDNSEWKKEQKEKRQQEQTKINKELSEDPMTPFYYVLLIGFVGFLFWGLIF